MSDEKEKGQVISASQVTGSVICRKVPPEINKAFKEEVKKIARKHGLRVNFIEVN